MSETSSTVSPPLAVRWSLEPFPPDSPKPPHRTTNKHQSNQRPGLIDPSMSQAFVFCPQSLASSLFLCGFCVKAFRSLSALERLLDRRFEILLPAEPRVDDLARLVQHHDERGCRHVVRARRVALRIEELIARNAVLLDERLHARGRLIHRDRDADELHLRAV